MRQVSLLLLALALAACTDPEANLSRFAPGAGPQGPSDGGPVNASDLADWMAQGADAGMTPVGTPASAGSVGMKGGSLDQVGPLLDQVGPLLDQASTRSGP